MFNFQVTQYNTFTYVFVITIIYQNIIMHNIQNN